MSSERIAVLITTALVVMVLGYYMHDANNRRTAQREYQRGCDDGFEQVWLQGYDECLTNTLEIMDRKGIGHVPLPPADGLHPPQVTP